MSESQDQAREREEHVAVLEYELRKANDTIEKLRARLTSVAAEEQFSPTTQSSSLSSVPLSSSSANATVGEHNHLDRKQTTVAAKSFEKRTINYLINEFLRDTGRKMAAITFANEVFFFLCTSPRGYSLTHCLFFFFFFFFHPVRTTTKIWKTGRTSGLICHRLRPSSSSFARIRARMRRAEQVPQPLRTLQILWSSRSSTAPRSRTRPCALALWH